MAFIKYTEKQERLRQEAKEFVKDALTPEIAEWCFQSILPVYKFDAAKPFIAKLAERGWLVPWLPEEQGGINASHVDTLVLNDAILEEGVIAPALLVLIGPTIVAPALARIGTEEQKKEYLPKIAKGETEFCIGYTEPEAGTDLASLQMHAVEDGDDYIINGQKCFNTHAHVADYHWILVRTDPTAPRHKGVSLFIVDLKSPGITVRPMHCMGGERTNEVFYDNVRVPKKNMVAEKNKGFYYVMTALEFERYFPTGGHKFFLNNLIGLIREMGLDKDRIIQQKIAQMEVEFEVSSLFSHRMAQLLDEGKMPIYEVSMTKVFSTESMHHMYATALQLMGLLGLTEANSKWGPLVGKVQDVYQRSLVGLIGGGTNDMLRGSMVTRGFGIPPAW